MLSNTITFQPFFAYLYKQNFVNDGWTLFRTEREFRRQVICEFSVKYWFERKILAHAENALDANSYK